MWMKTLAIIWLFILRLRFPTSSSIAEIIRIRYGNEIVKLMRKFESQDFKIRKIKLDIRFLQSCLEENLIPTFLDFRTANRNLPDSEAYIQCET